MPLSVRLEVIAGAEGSSGPWAAFQLVAPLPHFHTLQIVVHNALPCAFCLRWETSPSSNRHTICNAPAGLPTFGWTCDRLILVT